MTIKSLKDLQNINVEAVAKAIEKGAGQAVPGIRQALREAKAGKVCPPRPTFKEGACVTHADYVTALAELSDLVDLDPALGTPERDRLEALVTVVQAYEKVHYPRE